jgi:hypothetical protein
MKKLLILCACYHYDDTPIFRLRSSCEKMGLDFRYYGLQEKFYNWKQAKLDDLSHVLNSLIGEYEYVMVSDGFDTFMLQDQDFIIKTFEQLNAPLVVSAEMSCSPIPELISEYPPAPTMFKFVCGGQFMGKTEDVARIVGTLSKCYDNHEITHNQGGNDQVHWTLGFLEKKLGIKLDYYCQLFLSMNGLGAYDVDFHNQQLYLPLTSSYPCSIHFNGPKGDAPNGKNMDVVYNKFINL